MQRFTPATVTLALFCILSSTLMAADNAGQQFAMKSSLFGSDPGGQNSPANNQNPGASQSPGSLPRSSVQLTPLSNNEKFHYYLKSTYGPGSLAYTAFGAGLKQAEGSVSEWGGGMEGYGKRFASTFGQKIVDRSVRIGLNTLLHEDPRYIRSTRSGIWSRTLYAASQALWVRKDSGGARIGYSKFAGKFSAAYISRQWHPDSYHTVGDYLGSGAANIGIDAAKNILNEFWPDIKKMLRR